MTSKLADYCPELVSFIQNLAIQYADKYVDWHTFAAQCDTFYTDEMMQKLDSLTANWIEMASHRNRLTLYHVTGVLLALYQLPEYLSATATQQALMEWMVLFHDITKIPIKGGHDYIHGFKSAAVAGKALTKLGFPLLKGQSDDNLDNWYNLTYNAITYDKHHNEYVQDNSKLPQIIAALKSLHSINAQAIILGILLHISIVTVPDYPILAPITEDEIIKYISAEVFPIIEVMYLADNDGWTLFDRDKTDGLMRKKHTQATFAALKEKF